MHVYFVCLRACMEEMPQLSYLPIISFKLAPGIRRRGGRILLEDRQVTSTQEQSTSASPSAEMDACDAECTIDTFQSGTDAMNNSISRVRVVIPKRTNSANAVLVPVGQLEETPLTPQQVRLHIPVCEGTKSNFAPKSVDCYMHPMLALLLETDV